MKKGIKIILSIFLGLMTVSCGESYLDIVPEEIATEEDAFSDPESAKDYLYSVYAYIPNKRDGTNTLDLLTTDEIAASMQHEVFANYKQGNYTASNPVITMYQTLYKGIRQANVLKEKVDDVDGLSANKAERYKAEADFLIGYFYYYLLRAYGPLVLIDEVGDINTPDSEFLERSNVDDVAEFIVNKLDQAAQVLPDTQSGSSYGRASKIAAKALKAKTLFWVASPLLNGGGESNSSLYDGFVDSEGNELIPTTYDESKWERAADALAEAINSAESEGIKLYEKEASMSAPLPEDPVERNLRFTFIDKSSDEMIWVESRQETAYNFQNKTSPLIEGVNADATGNGLGPTLEIIEEFHTKNGLPIDLDPDYDYSGRYDIVNTDLGNTLKLNLDREPRFNAWISYHNSYYEVKRDDDFQVLTQYRKQDPMGKKSRNSNYTPTGYLNKKGVHPEVDQSRFQVSQHYPWPIIRLSDLYLSYAEALIEYGQDLNTAKKYIDYVRDRAGIPEIDDAWSAIGGANDQETLRKIVRQERTIEFYLENHRYWDLRRWQTAENHLGDRVHGLNVEGETDDDFFQIKEVPFNRKFSRANYLSPIPQQEVDNNELMLQNPGY